MTLDDMSIMNIFTRGDFPNKYWVYAVYTLDKEPKFIWYDRLCDIITQSSLKKTEDYDPTIMYRFSLLKCCDSKIKAENSLNEIIDINGKTPPYNLRFHTYNNRYRIACIETGDVYNNASDACKLLGLSTSALCNHLQRKPGFKQVKGLRFIYTTAPFNVNKINIHMPNGFGALPTVHRYEGEE